MGPLLEVRHISKYFKARIRTRALDDVSFSLERGTILGILGPNGAGKTTLLKIISTLILPEEGSVSVNGYVLGEDDLKIRQCAGFASSSERSFYWRLTGRQNLEFFAALYGLSRTRAKNRIEELFGLFEVDYQDKRFDSYSAGMQQKFSLIRALLHDPVLLLLDEPTRSLDYTAALSLRNFIKERLSLTQRKTILFTTHNMEEAMDFADTLMILHKGKVFAFGTLAELRQKCNDPGAGLGKIFSELTHGN